MVHGTLEHPLSSTIYGFYVDTSRLLHTNENKVSMVKRALVEHACFVENASKHGHINHFHVHKVYLTMFLSGKSEFILLCTLLFD